MSGQTEDEKAAAARRRRGADRSKQATGETGGTWHLVRTTGETRCGAPRGSGMTSARQIPEAQRCKKSGCRGHWPGAWAAP